MKNMNNISRKNLVFHCTAGSFAIIVTGMVAPLKELQEYIIVSDVSISQEQQKIIRNGNHKVHGTFWNEGILLQNILTAIVIFSDGAHNKVVRKNVSGRRGPASEKQVLFMEFDSGIEGEKYQNIGERNYQFDWTETDK